MSNGRITDPEERRAKAAGKLLPSGSKPPTAPKPYVPPTAVTLLDGRTIYKPYSWVVKYESNKNRSIFKQYPAFYEGLVNQWYAQGDDLTVGQTTDLAGRYGVPTETILAYLRNSGGGAGGGVNKANEIKALTALVSDEAAKLGLTMSADQIATIATIAQKEGWTSAQIVDDLTKTVNFGSLQAGSLLTDVANFKTVGQNYLVNISDATAQQWALKIARGESTVETILNSIKEQAKAANPWLAQFIDKGIDPIDALAGNRDFIAKNLEIDAASLDLMDSKILNMMTVTDPNGTRRLANQGEMIKNVRQDDRWKNTNNAKELGANTANLLGRIFGRSVY